MAEAGVSVLKVEGNTVQEVVEAYKLNQLEEISEGCYHDHHCH
jgi:predicted Fe-Mo cluster-binding NifX family protein